MMNTYLSTPFANAAFAGFAMAAILAAISIPMSASAALYGYIDTAGYLRTVESTSWQAAITTAPSIHMHSGVMLMNTAARLDLVGERI